MKTIWLRHQVWREYVYCFIRERSGTVSIQFLIHPAGSCLQAAFALRGPRRHIVDERQSEVKAVFRRVRAKILVITRQGISLETFIEENAAKEDQVASNRTSAAWQFGEYARELKERLITTLRKTRGGGVQPPPTMSWKQTLLTFSGVFITLLMITRLNIYVVSQHGPDYEIVLG